MGCLMLAHFDVRAAATLCLKLREKRTQRGRRVSVAIDPNGRLSLLAKVPLIASRSAAKGPTTPSDGTIRQINPTDASITLMDDVVSVTPSRRRPAREIKSAYSRWVRSRPGSKTSFGGPRTAGESIGNPELSDCANDLADPKSSDHV